MKMQRQEGETEELLKKKRKIVDTWRLFFQPGSIIRYFNLEKRIAKLDNGREAPTLEDWVAGVSMEAMKAVMYAGPLIYIGMETYNYYVRNQ